jgi:sugar (pentulose or hexulose) kinase
VIEKLTGNHVCHITNAAPMGFVNLQKKAWDMDILRRAGLDFLKLPELIPDIRCCGLCRMPNGELWRF